MGKYLNSLSAFSRQLSAFSKPFRGWKSGPRGAELYQFSQKGLFPVHLSPPFLLAGEEY
jgi:hypothetical protein